MHDGAAQGGEAREQVLRRVCRRVAPAALVVFVGAGGAGGDVDAAEFGVEDGRGGFVRAAGVVGEGREEGWAVGCEERGEVGGAFGERGGVGVVVEGGEVGDDVFPAAVVVDGAGGVDGS